MPNDQVDGAEYPPELSRLPPGRHGLPRDFVVHNQRERLIAGLAEAVAEKGYGGTTIADITRHAAVSRRTFYEHFASKEECFVALLTEANAEMMRRISASVDPKATWAAQVRQAVEAWIECAESAPEIGRAHV